MRLVIISTSVQNLFLLHYMCPLLIQVHDRMTEQVYPTPLRSFKTDTLPTAVFTVPVMAKGAAALEEINEVLLVIARLFCVKASLLLVCNPGAILVQMSSPDRSCSSLLSYTACVTHSRCISNSEVFAGLCLPAGDEL